MIIISSVNNSINFRQRITSCMLYLLSLRQGQLVHDSNIIKRNGLRAELCCKPTETPNASVSPCLVRTRMKLSLYMSIMNDTYGSGTAHRRSVRQISS